MVRKEDLPVEDYFDDYFEQQKKDLEEMFKEK